MTPTDALTLPRLPTLILLPGLDGTGDFFQPLLDEIGGTIAATVVRYPIDGGYDYDSCLEIVRAMLPTDGKYVLLGESFSGPLAVTLASRAPPGLAGLILSSTFVRNPRPRLAFIRPLLPYLPFHGSGLSLSLSRFTVLGRWITPPIRRLHESILSRVPAETLRRRLVTVADCDVGQELSRVGVPILCLVPTHDRLVPRSAAHLIQQQAPGAGVVEIEAPHCLLQCAPGPAVARIRAFLRSLP